MRALSLSMVGLLACSGGAGNSNNPDAGPQGSVSGKIVLNGAADASGLGVVITGPTTAARSQLLLAIAPGL